MRKLVVILALLLPVSAFAQMSFGGRASVEADYKVFKGFHISAGEEIRSADNFAGLGSLRTSVGLSYKPVKFLKVGVGYTLINPYKIGKELDDNTEYSGFWAPRHRVYGDVTGYLKLGWFQLFLKERLQLTHNADVALNPYQSTRNALALKSKIGVKYKGFQWIEPELSFEMRTALNEPWGVVSGSEQTTANSNKKYYAYTHTGYTNVYNNRYRVNLGADINLSKHHTLSPYVLFDYTSDYKIDTNGADKWATKGVRLYSETTGWQYGTMLTVGLSYSFNF